MGVQADLTFQASAVGAASVPAFAQGNSNMGGHDAGSRTVPPGVNTGLGMNLMDAFAGLVQTVAATSEAVAGLANAFRNDRGQNPQAECYRHLKPKKDLQKITAIDAKTLMIELADFEVDLGELGVPTQSEAAYRQLRAVYQGRTLDVVDLELVREA